MTAHMLSDCDWKSIEKGKAEGGNYSILRCQLCGRETAIGMGERIHPAQFSCPFDVKDK
jgi:rRNA maturation protein Nop10